jgi:glycosyltransferase involved in cell wall biosynthesis
MNTRPSHTELNLHTAADIDLTTHHSKVGILLCTYNGAAYIQEQLRSFATQTHKDWVIYASDDGSSDDTIKHLKNFQLQHGEDRLIILNGPHQGFAKNFLSLIKNRSIEADYFAFSDQDDVWFPDKLERSIAQLEPLQDTPALYCSRTRLVSADGQFIGLSPRFSAPPHFRNALVQSIAGANTMLINRQARALLAKTPDQSIIVAHDWLTYLLVSGCGGKVFFDQTPTLDYRQHDGNLIGANSGLRARLTRLVKMCTGRFKEWSDQNLNVLAEFKPTLTTENRRALEQFEQARQSALFPRLRLMKEAGIYRQTSKGNVSLFLAACLNKI